MLISTASVASVIVFVVGALVWWSNPSRAVNKAIFGCSLVIAAWLGCLHMAAYVFGGAHPRPQGLFWLRLACAIGASLAMRLWVTKEAIVGGVLPRLTEVRWRLWALFSVGMAALCFTGYFIPLHPSPGAHRTGDGYYIFIAFVLGAHLLVLAQTIRRLRILIGAARMELQVWMIGSSSMMFVIMATMTLNALTKNHIYIELQPLFVLGFYGGAVYAITTHRIFNAGQIVRVVVSRLCLAATTICLGYVMFLFSSAWLPRPVAFGVGGLAIVLVAAVVGRWLDRRFELYPQAREARRAAFEVASREVRLDRLEDRFVEILTGWGQTENALMLSSTDGSFQKNGVEFGEAALFQLLREIKWATPERLARERTTTGHLKLARFLQENRLGIVVMIDGPALAAVVGVGVPISRRPYTFPQATQLIELAAIFAGPLERAHLAGRMHHAEQLATVGMLGASLAHEIRNPLVSLKAFVQLLPTHHHDPVFRDKFFILMGDEVKRIDRLTEQLLDLASPRGYSPKMIDLHSVIRAGLELVAPRAMDAEVSIVTQLNDGTTDAYTDPSAVKQVLLNLCFNAIQALDGRPGERWVRVATSANANAVEIVVSDSGPGIAPEMAKKLFQPFQSSKSSGFGLGLAICRDILTGLNATIAAEPAKLGEGATFRVILPCHP